MAAVQADQTNTQVCSDLGCFLERCSQNRSHKALDYLHVGEIQLKMSIRCTTRFTLEPTRTLVAMSGMVSLLRPHPVTSRSSCMADGRVAGGFMLKLSFISPGQV